MRVDVVVLNRTLWTGGPDVAGIEHRSRLASDDVEKSKIALLPYCPIALTRYRIDAEGRTPSTED
jgi:hypothetical protein